MFYCSRTETEGGIERGVLVSSGAEGNENGACRARMEMSEDAFVFEPEGYGYRWYLGGRVAEGDSTLQGMNYGMGPGMGDMM